ncbi:MAG: hypothetical protein H0W72_14600 [Planctomycetes bacterium]|nr:hypothetical protein [Planctomycetota bacterium]
MVEPVSPSGSGGDAFVVPDRQRSPDPRPREDSTFAAAFARCIALLIGCSFATAPVLLLFPGLSWNARFAILAVIVATILAIFFGLGFRFRHGGRRYRYRSHGRFGPKWIIDLETRERTNLLISYALRASRRGRSCAVGSSGDSACSPRSRWCAR